MIEDQQIEVSRIKNLICNFRAPNMEQFLRWKAYVQWAKDNGMDVCHLTLSLTDAFVKGIDGVAQLQTGKQVVNIQQNNVFQYQVSKPRREPYNLNCVKSEFRRTFSSILFDAYILHKARRIGREFSYRDFLELEKSTFHRIIRRLRRKGEIVTNPLRTNPRFYFLAEKIVDYQH